MILNKRMKILFLCFASALALAVFSFASEGGFSYPEHTGRDPFQPLIDSKGVLNVKLIRSREDLMLNGIIYAEKKSERIAVINSESFRAGDIVGNYEIKDITPNKVVLIKGSKKTVLTMEVEDKNEK